MITFTFNGQNSSTVFNLLTIDIIRPLVPNLRKNEMIIPGRHGTYDFENNTYDNRMIEVIVKYTGTSFANYRTQARTLAAWLGQTEYKQLIFSDETDKYYMARVYEVVGLKNLFALEEASIVFECQPYAYNVADDGYTFVL